MAKNRLTKEEIERDELAEGVHSFVTFLENHYGKLLIGGLAIIVAILVVVSVQARDARITSEVNANIAEALNQLSMIEAEADLDQRRTQAETLISGLDTLIATYPGSQLANQAYFLKGKALYAVDRFDEAQPAYQTFINTAETAEQKARGEMALGYAYENQGFLTDDPTEQKNKLQAAMASYERAALGLPGSYIAAYATMGQARVHEALGDRARAIEFYEKVIASRPAPALANLPATDGSGAEADLSRALRSMVNRMEAQLSFEKTAELRLASLRGTTATLEQPVTAAP